MLACSSMDLPRLPLGPADHTSDPLDYFVETPKDGVSAGCRIDKADKQRIAMIVQSGSTRYKTESDLLRAALHWFLFEKLAPRMDGRFQADLRLAHAAVRRAQMMARIQDSNNFVRDISSSIKALVLQNAIDQAVECWLDAMKVCYSSAEPFASRARDALLADQELAFVREKAKAEELDTSTDLDT